LLEAPEKGGTLKKQTLGRKYSQPSGKVTGRVIDEVTDIPKERYTVLKYILATTWKKKYTSLTMSYDEDTLILQLQGPGDIVRKAQGELWETTEGMKEIPVAVSEEIVTCMKGDVRWMETINAEFKPPKKVRATIFFKDKKPTIVGMDSGATKAANKVIQTLVKEDQIKLSKEQNEFMKSYMWKEAKRKVEEKFIVSIRLMGREERGILVIEGISGDVKKASTSIKDILKITAVLQ
jgi:hypothetical protein